MDRTIAPNHHAHHPGFAGITGLVAALSFTVGRGDDARLAARLAGVGVDDTVVDIGCGPGVAVRHAAALGASVIGVDPAPVMLRIARLLGPRGRVRYLEGAAEALPVPDGGATVAWSLATVHHWADLDAGLQEVRRVLEPGGRFVVIEKLVQPGATGHASHGWMPHQAEAFAERLAAAGFAEVAVERHAGRRQPFSVRAVRAG